MTKMNLLIRTSKRGTPGKSAARRGWVALWLSILVCLLLSAVFITPHFHKADAQTRQQISLTVQTSQPGCIVPYLEYPISFDGNTYPTMGTDITSDVYIMPAPTQVSISMPERPRVKVARVEVVLGENRQTFTADASGVAVVSITRTLETPTIVVYLSGLCDNATIKTTEKYLEVLLSSRYCKSDPQWDGLSVFVGNDHFVALDAKWVSLSTRLINLKITSQDPVVSVILLASAFPNSKLEDVTLSKYSDGHLRRIIGEYKPHPGEQYVPITLDQHLWEMKINAKPSLKIRISGNCEDPGNPEEFGLVRVKAVSGDVEIERPVGFSTEKREPKVDDKYRGGTLITTEKDGLIILESEYKHTITIDGSTQVRLADVMTPSGREQLTALIQRGKIKIHRRGGDAQNTVVQTDTATVSSIHTIYSVTYDHSTRLTTVNVDEGEVEIFPANETLESLTLIANEHAQVSEKRVIKGGSGFGTGTLIIYGAIGAWVLIVLLVLILIIYVVYRVSKPGTAQRHFQPARQRPERPAQTGGPQWQTAERRCSNPRCGAPMLVNNNFCGVCGSTLN